jgi:hypothetical protein
MCFVHCHIYELNPDLESVFLSIFISIIWHVCIVQALLYFSMVFSYFVIEKSETSNVVVQLI